MNEPLSHDARSSQFGATTMTDKVPHALASLCALVVLSIAVSLQPAPPLPVWPDQFTSDFWVRVGIYGPNWNSTAKIFYDWTSKVFVVFFRLVGLIPGGLNHHVIMQSQTHPLVLTRENSLVHEVKFLKLVHALVTV